MSQRKRAAASGGHRSDDESDALAERMRQPERGMPRPAAPDIKYARRHLASKNLLPRIKR